MEVGLLIGEESRGRIFASSPDPDRRFGDDPLYKLEPLAYYVYALYRPRTEMVDGQCKVLVAGTLRKPRSGFSDRSFSGFIVDRLVVPDLPAYRPDQRDPLPALFRVT